MNNPETSVTLGTQDTGQHVDSKYIRFTLYNSTSYLPALKSVKEEPRTVFSFSLLINVTDNRSGNQERTTQRHRQHWAHKTQDKDNPETSGTLGTQNTGQTIQRHRQHWAHKT